MHCENIELGIVGVIVASVFLTFIGRKIIKNIREAKELREELKPKKEK
ncbi:MAG: hypothetical protein ACTSXL_02160 [Alphaproteobacteria bacterium]